MYISSPTNTHNAKAVGNTSLARVGRKTEKVSYSSSQRSTYYDLDDTHRRHSWLRANIAAFGRSVVGPGMSLSTDPMYGGEATTEEKEFLYNFYHGITGRDFKNISDWYPASSKLYRTVGQFRLFGQSVWEIRRNGFDEAVSYDIVPGFIFPNCKSGGEFMDPPFYQYLSEGSYMHPLDLDPDDIVIFMQPDFGSRLFSTDFEALTEFTLPTDLYLSDAMRGALQNYRSPMGMYTLHEFATDDDVKNFSKEIDTLYRGPSKYGSSAVVVRGETEFKTFSVPLKDLPFQTGHAAMQDEIEAVSGVSGAKLGRTGEINRSNMKEVRRDYWETTHQPIGIALADQMYLLIHMRIFGIRSWRPLFNAPDFLTQVEKATVGMRGRQNSGMSTNEFRKFVFGYPPIEEEWADNDYMWPKNMVAAGSTDSEAPVAGDPDSGEEPVDEPNTDSDPPIRGDTDNTEDTKRAAIAEMKAYSRFCLNRHDQKNRRQFDFKYTPREVVELVNDALTEFGTSKDGVKQIFEVAISGMEG